MPRCFSTCNSRASLLRRTDDAMCLLLAQPLSGGLDAAVLLSLR